MSIQLEVTHKDVMGRNGRLHVSGRRIQTPALLPVVNPHLQLLTPREMWEMGCEAIITNAYIFMRSQEFSWIARERGIHEVLDFPGLIMTDSGSFQLAVYGEVEVNNLETLTFQQEIGSDIMVPLDIPTPPDAPRERAESDLALTMERLREARDIAGEDAEIAGPVQGGRYPDLRQSAAEAVQDLGFSFCPVGAVVPLMERYRYRELVDVVLAARRGLSPSSCLHLFGAGHPMIFALAVAMGCDLFDSAAYALYAREGRYLTISGTRKIEELHELPCSCEVCRSYTAGELRSAEERERLLAKHNLLVSLAEIATIRQAIRDGTLWELVDSRCRSHPRLLEGYRRLLQHAEELEPYDTVSKRRFFYQGVESCRRTEVVRYRSLLSRVDAGRRVLIAFDGRKSAPGFDTVLSFKPPFGPYPPALGETFPVGQAEIPVWDDDLVRAGCEGIREFARVHPQSSLYVAPGPVWSELVRREIPDIEVIE
ncbi:MAG: tRNA guanosine(15) transglycosylase TgtA [Methanoculleaceae archaeon]